MCEVLKVYNLFGIIYEFGVVMVDDYFEISCSSCKLFSEKCFELCGIWVELIY